MGTPLFYHALCTALVLKTYPDASYASVLGLSLLKYQRNYIRSIIP
jgi:hypothetical protein